MHIYKIFTKGNLFFILSNLQSNLLQLDLPKTRRHIRGKWLTHGPIYYKDDQS